jgi:hypothetical protein
LSTAESFELKRKKEKKKEKKRKSKVKKRKTAWRSWGRADAREHLVYVWSNYIPAVFLFFTLLFLFFSFFFSFFLFNSNDSAVLSLVSEKEEDCVAQLGQG